MLNGVPLIDAHVHVPPLKTLRPGWIRWARDFGPDGILEDAWDAVGLPRPQRLDELFAEQGVDAAPPVCEYSPETRGTQTFDDLVPIVAHDPRRFRPVVDVNPNLHHPIAAEVQRQRDLGAAALKLHPVQGRFRCDDRSLYPAYQVLQERRVPLMFHFGSSFPGSVYENADPQILLPVTRDFPGMDIVLGHGGRLQSYDLTAYKAPSHETVWIELSGLPPKRRPGYYARFDLNELACRWIFGTDWPGVPETAKNATAVAMSGGNARRVNAGLPQLNLEVPAEAALNRREEV